MTEDEIKILADLPGQFRVGQVGFEKLYPLRKRVLGLSGSSPADGFRAEIDGHNRRIHQLALEKKRLAAAAAAGDQSARRLETLRAVHRENPIQRRQSP